MGYGQIKSLWESLERQGFPNDCHNKSFDGVNTTILYSDLSSLILTYLETHGVLGRRQILVLDQSLLQAKKLIPLLPSERARNFFSELAMLGEKVKAGLPK